MLHKLKQITLLPNELVVQNIYVTYNMYEADTVPGHKFQKHEVFQQSHQISVQPGILKGTCQDIVS